MNNMLQIFIGAWLHPWKTMGMVREQPEDSSIVPSLLYVVAMSVVSGVISIITLMMYPDPTMGTGLVARIVRYVWILVFPVIGSFINSLIVWGIVTGFVRGTANEFKTIFRLTAVTFSFPPVLTLLAAFLPKLGTGPVAIALLSVVIAIGIWATVVMIGGVIIVMNTPKARTIATFIILPVVFVVLFAVMLSQSRSALQNPSLAGGDYGAQNFDLPDEELDAQLDDLTGKQGQPAAGTPSKAAAPTKK